MLHKISILEVSCGVKSDIITGLLICNNCSFYKDCDVGPCVCLWNCLKHVEFHATINL